MVSILLQEDHYSVAMTREIGELASPLKRYGVENFCHVRYFDDGAVSVLINNRELYIHHFKCGYKVGPDFPFAKQDLQQEGYRYYLANQDPDEPYSAALNDYTNLFGLDNFIFLINASGDYVDYFIFGAARYNWKIINFYLNSRSVLEQFVFDFKQKAFRLINKSMQNKIILPNSMQMRFDLA